MEMIVRLAGPAVPGAEHAGVTRLRRDGSVHSAAATDAVVLKLDRLQAELDGGPCMAAMHGLDLVRVDDMATELRWPRFAASALELGIGSMVSCRIATVDGTRAALNLHAGPLEAFDDDAVQLAAVYTAHATIALQNTGLVTSLRASVATRQVIGEATGILMERHRLPERQAFQLLVTGSQKTNTKLRDIAERVVTTGEDL